MVRAEVDWLLCQACDDCTARWECRTRAVVKMDAGEPAYIEYSRCNGCAKCVPACPFGAILVRSQNGPLLGD